MKATSQFFVLEPHDAIFADSSGVKVGTGTTLFLRGDADAMDRLAAAAVESARAQRSQARLPGCDGGDYPEAAA